MKQNNKCFIEHDYSVDPPEVSRLEFHDFKRIDEDHEECKDCGLKTTGFAKYIEKHKIFEFKDGKFIRHDKEE